MSPDQKRAAQEWVREQEMEAQQINARLEARRKLWQVYDNLRGLGETGDEELDVLVLELRKAFVPVEDRMRAFDQKNPDSYSGATFCRKCCTVHWMHGPCPRTLV